jgi:hypothetical protein
MYVMSDPYATAYVTDDVMAVANGLTADIDAVTSATYGAATVASTAVVEVACAFVTAPAATPDKTAYTVAGTTDVAGYVYCWGENDGTAKPAVVTDAAAARIL